MHTSTVNFPTTSVQVLPIQKQIVTGVFLLKVKTSDAEKPSRTGKTTLRTRINLFEGDSIKKPGRQTECC